ncbi:putative lysosomal alpha-glucosidase-like [Apostichopus japonicus]|uniref:Putative lysosomal alpha-glucosidase-like n=1 Tax=Stichopus japonicus TaxID=307972 RepID=A0A2G8L870_STIJA|nr:putative lysosomal alpha-glucosidase-like [Apostichopus japonicus]
MDTGSPFFGLLLCVAVCSVTFAKECGMSVYYRFDCYPEAGSNQGNCEARGCCWDDSKEYGDVGIPYCFYPTDYEMYQISGPVDTDFGCTANLTRSQPSYYPDTIKDLKLDIYYETKTRLHFKIYDATQKRYEVPIDTPKVTHKASETDYSVLFPSYGFGFGVTRKSTDLPIFNTSVNNGGFLFNDQFIQISTILASNYIYGLGEHRGSLLRSPNWSRFTFGIPTILLILMPLSTVPIRFTLDWSRPTATPTVCFSLTVMLWAIIQPAPAITFRTIGGILDFYIFLGPTPSDVIQQYLEVIGQPFLPPYWGLGFHLCRWGYKSANRTQEIVNRMRAARIPQDTQWNDIDYMQSHEDFTTDSKSFSNLPDVVADLHNHKQHYISMIDPAISSSQPAGSYAPYDDGVKADVFVKDANGKILVGKVWPGNTAFPDFFKPETSGWWNTQLKGFHSQVQFDGVWLDMNEPSNFVDGSFEGCPGNSTLDNPPYLPSLTHGTLYGKTLCPSSQQAISSHYNLHNMFGISEVMVTNKVISQLRGKRPFIISRSTFPSSGVYGGHWLGDNYSKWPDMHYSITGILNFNMFGIPLVGADICGFNDNTNEELCVRWHQLGAFYPFSRNHNSLTCGPKLCIDQDPGAWSSASQDIIRDALTTRYLLLPYLYTLFAEAHINGSTVARPLFFEFPHDPYTYAVDRQFLWGSSLLISPVLDPGAQTIKVTLPAGTWYDFYNGSAISISTTANVTLDAPMEKINLHMREGGILPLQQPNTTTYVSRQGGFELRAAICSKTGTAEGSLYWDDGDTIGTYENGEYIFLKFSLASNTFVSKVVHNKYKDAGDMVLSKVTLYGVAKDPKSVTVNGKAAHYSYVSEVGTLKVSGLYTPMNDTITVKWNA